MRWRWAIAISLGCVAIAAAAAVWPGRLPLEGLLLRAVSMDQNFTSQKIPFDLQQLRRAVRLYAVILLLLASIIPWLFQLPRRFWSPLRSRLFEISMTLGCSSAILLLLMRTGYEGSWYPIQTLMTNPGAVPIFGHRLLWVWVADACRHLVPSLSYLQCYFLSQILSIFLTVMMIGRWSELFVGRSLRWTGQALLVAILGPTLTYYTFYDISIVFFFALGLFLLHQRQYFWFALAVGVATLNHENVLLLVIVAGIETFRRSFRLGILVTLGSLFLHVVSRVVMERAFPSSRIVDWHVWTNLVFPFIYPRLVLVGALALVFWWIAAATSWPDVEPFLRTAAVLFPLLLATTFVYGQINEARVFDALIPVVIGFILSFGKAKTWEANSNFREVGAA